MAASNCSRDRNLRQAIPCHAMHSTAQQYALDCWTVYYRHNNSTMSHAYPPCSTLRPSRLVEPQNLENAMRSVLWGMPARVERISTVVRHTRPGAVCSCVGCMTACMSERWPRHGEFIVPTLKSRKSRLETTADTPRL